MSGECVNKCNDLKTAVLTMEMCAAAKKVLPRPKVGDFCSIAMEQGFNDVCINLCLGQEPVSRLAQTCKSAAIEMPRPTVRKWCEHGYQVAWQKTSRDLQNYFVVEPTIGSAEEVFEPPVAESVTPKEQDTPAAVPDNIEEIKIPELAIADVIQKEESSGADIDAVLEPTPVTPPKVSRTLPIELDDGTIDLEILEGQTPDDAVVVFCRTNMSEDISGCIRQLLPTVLERLGEN